MDQRDCSDLPDQNRLDSLIDSLEMLVDPDEGYDHISATLAPTQSKKSGRNILEARTQLDRQQDRGKETVTKRTNALFHMIRVLSRNGLCIESFCNHDDSDGSGSIRRAHFAKILKNLGFPFSWKDLNDILLRYSYPPKFDSVDYQSFLGDAGATSKSEKSLPDAGLDVGAGSQNGWRMYTRVLLDVKRTLTNDSVCPDRQQKKIYKTFAAWDKSNTGSITAIQFLRVLVRQGVELQDQDQDFIVDLLDTSSMGRIDYESLLKFFFSGSDAAGDKQEYFGESSESDCGASATMKECEDLRQSAFSDDSMVIDSIENVYQVGGDGSRSSSCMDLVDDTDGQVLTSRQTPFERVPLSSRSGSSYGSDRKDSITGPSSKSHVDDFKLISSFKQKLRSASEYGSQNPDNVNIEGDCDGRSSLGKLQRRSGESSENISSKAKGKSVTESDVVSSSLRGLKSRTSSAFLSDIEEHSGRRLTHCSEKGEYSPTSSLDNISNTQSDPTFHGDGTAKIKRGRWEGVVEECDTETVGYESWNRLKRDSTESGREVYPHSSRLQALPSFRDRANCITIPEGSLLSRLPSGSFLHTLDTPTSHFEEPTEYLNYIATQTLATVRDIVLARHRAGKTLSIIFRHFDRTGRNHFNAKDFMKAISDLRVDVAENVAMLAVSKLALDGQDTVSYGEFKVYLFDPLHASLEKEVVKCMVEQFERRGREFQLSLQNWFWEEEQAMNRGATSARVKEGVVSKKSFIAVMKKFGIKISNADIDRLVARFGTDGESNWCSAAKFIRMIERSEQWITLAANSMHQEVAVKEASILRAEVSSNKAGRSGNNSFVSFGGIGLSEETISMAECLGIKVISEQHLLWIVRDALNVALPSPWARVKHISGKPSFYNQNTGRHRSDHPLEDHFKELRDLHRQRKREVGNISGTTFQPMVEGLKSVPSSFYHGFLDPQQPLTAEFNTGPESAGSTQQLFLTEKFDKDKRARGLNCNERGTWHLPVEQGNPLNAYNTFNISPGLKNENGKEIRLPGLPTLLKEKISSLNSPLQFSSNPSPPLRSAAYVPVSLPDTHNREHTTTSSIGQEYNFLSALSPVRPIGVDESQIQKEVKKKGGAQASLLNQSAAVKSYSPSFSRPSTSVVDRLMNINKSRK